VISIGVFGCRLFTRVDVYMAADKLAEQRFGQRKKFPARAAFGAQGFGPTALYGCCGNRADPRAFTVTLSPNKLGDRPQMST